MKPCILSAAVLISVFLTGHAKLMLLQWVFRHGDRAPERLYPNDPNTEDLFAEGLGSLTLLGKRQHYTLGRQLRSAYSEFITSSPNEVYVTSTGRDRCLRSAQCHLAGLYAPTPEWQISPDIPNWQPIPVHYDKQDQDEVLNPKKNCPAADDEADRIYNSDGFQHFEDENEAMFSNLSSCAGHELNRNFAQDLAATLRVEKKKQLEIPPCFLPYYEQLQLYREVTHNIVFKSELIQRLRAGPLLGEILDKMKQKIDGDIPDLKVNIFSARDSTLLALLAALGNFQEATPPYCATVILELHRADDNEDDFSVRLLFLNSTRPEDGDQRPRLLQLPGCDGEFCPHDQFANSTRRLVPHNWEKECKTNHPTSTKKPKEYEPVLYV